jgi:hypothetical protein
MTMTRDDLSVAISDLKEAIAAEVGQIAAVVSALEAKLLAAAVPVDYSAEVADIKGGSSHRKNRRKTIIAAFSTKIISKSQENCKRNSNAPSIKA